MTFGTPWWVPPLLFFVAALVQASFLPSLGFVAVRPDFVVQSVIIWAVLRGVREALLWAFAGGLVLDLFSGGPFGTATLALLIVAFFASVGELRLLSSNVILPVLAVFWGSVLYSAIFLFLLATHEYNVAWLGTFREVVVPTALVNTALAPATYWLLARLERRTRRTVPVEW
ncbi:MAG: rod shape-determining protein MreD [Chloroflexi bacterium]|nr:rod shape-determining protein MreD [Chloroflexota bacterium]